MPRTSLILVFLLFADCGCSGLSVIGRHSQRSPGAEEHSVCEADCHCEAYYPPCEDVEAETKQED